MNLNLQPGFVFASESYAPVHGDQKMRTTVPPGQGGFLATCLKLHVLCLSLRMCY